MRYLLFHAVQRVIKIFSSGTEFHGSLQLATAVSTCKRSSRVRRMSDSVTSLPKIELGKACLADTRQECLELPALFEIPMDTIPSAQRE